MSDALKLLVETAAGHVRLLSPSVGLFTQSAARGAVLTPGANAGVLETLGVAHPLVVPPGVLGRVASDRPELIHAPVGYATPLYELAPLEAGAAAPIAPVAPARGAAGLVFRAPYSGRFWHRPSPHDPPFVAEGSEIADGDPLGLIEVMKTFTHLHYAAGEGLPARARVARILVPDGGEVSEGDPIVEVEAR
ncbi:MAG: biotin/lipoyl-containing protein [Planctomycetota bacterium]